MINGRRMEIKKTIGGPAPIVIKFPEDYKKETLRLMIFKYFPS